jgi:hypothetical protein
MKLTLLLPTLAIAMLMSSSYEASAFGGPPGGPFSNGSYFPNDGTFSAVVRGENLTGTLQFSTTSGAGPTSTDILTTGGVGGLGSTGVATIYYDGDTFQGNSQGALNAEASTMTVNFQADSQQQGQRDVTLQDLVVTSKDASGLEIYSVVDTGIINYFDSLYLNGFANCKTSNSFPTQKFEGTGEVKSLKLNFNGNTPFEEFVTFPITVTGVRLSNTATSFNVSDVRPPSVNEITIYTP